jgi:hypothetical protein
MEGVPMLTSRVSHLPVLCALLCSNAWGADPISVFNPDTKSVVAYQPLSNASKSGDYVYVDARRVHPTQFCLGYREVAFKAEMFSKLAADKTSHDPKASTYPYLAKKDVPIIIGPDGTPYLTDGHHTLAALLRSTQPDKTAFGHIVANFYGRPDADFRAYMLDPKNNVAYLYGPNGNGLLNAPAALAFDKLPVTVLSEDPSQRMANDFYRSLGWAMKDVSYNSKAADDSPENDLFENFIEFRWGDLLRDKVTWNDASDDSFYLAAANADALAHSESTTDLSGGVCARDLPGFMPARNHAAFTLNITDDSRIYGDITPPAHAETTLNINTQSSLIVSGNVSNLTQLVINGGGSAAPHIEKNSLTPTVTVQPGAGLVVLAGNSLTSTPTRVAQGQLNVNGDFSNADIVLKKDAMLRGSGHVGRISGAGAVEPGSSTGILTANSVDAEAGMALRFQFSAKEPDFGHPLNARNDVLVLTAAEPFHTPLSTDSSINIYFRNPLPHGVSTVTGGVFAKANFGPVLASVQIHAFQTDPHGTVLIGTTHFSPLDHYAVSCDTVPTTAPEAGFITRFTLTENH